LTPIILGVVFLIGPGVYALAAPMWGWITDKMVNKVSSYLLLYSIKVSETLPVNLTLVKTLMMQFCYFYCKIGIFGL